MKRPTTTKFGLIEKDLERIREACRRFPGIEAAVLFGSRAMGNFKKGSDVNIALTGDIDRTTLIRIKSLLNEETPAPYFFDVIDYRSIENRELKEHIDRYGTTLFQRESECPPLSK